MLVAAAAMAFTSCQKEEVSAPETVSVNLTMHAGVEETKTYLGENNEVLWGKGESVKLYVGAGETATFVHSTETDIYDGQKTASFTFAIEGVTESDSYSLGGVYPTSAVVSTNNTNPKSYKVQLPATQQSVDGNYDPSAYIMVLKPEFVEELPTEYQASFRRATALNKITLSNVAEDITSVEITVPEKKYLAGRRNIDLTTGESGEIYDSGTQTNTVKVTGDFKAGSFDVWFCSWGVELEGGETMTIKMTSANKMYTRSITARENGIKFVEGDLNKLSVNMESAEVEVLSSVVGKYLIASKTTSGWFLMTSTNAGKFYTATTSVSSAAEVTCADFYGVADVENYVWDVAKYDTGYSIKNTSTNKYVAYNGSSNEAYANSDLDDKAKMDIKLDGQSAVIESMNVAGRKLQYNASSPRFAFYTTAQTSVYMIPWTPDTTPRIFVDNKSFNVSADAITVDIPYTVNNITSPITATVADGATMSNVKATVADAKVTVTFDANTESTEKTATIVLSYEGAESVNVTVTQAAKLTEVKCYEKVNSAPSDWSGTYLIVYEATPAYWDGSLTPGTSSGQMGSTAGMVKTTITDGKIQSNSTVDKSVITIEKSGAGYALKAASGSYFGMSTNNNGLKSSTKATDYVHKITLESNGTVSILSSDGYTKVAYNKSSSFFRYYKVTTVSGNATSYPLPCLYKLTSGSEGGDTPEPDQPETPVEPIQLTMSDIVCSAQTENSLTFTWTAVENAIGYEVTCNNKTETVTTTQYEVTGLTASTSYTVSIVAKGDGINYTNSESKTQTGKTKDVQQPGEDASGTHYVKVTSTPSDWSGTYLIVYESGTTAYVYNGTDSGTKNYVTATISDGQIAVSSSVDAVAVQITKSGTGYSIKVSSGKYISGGTSNGTTFNANAVANTITLNSNGTVKINNNTTTSFQFNSASDQMRFRYFKSSQKSVCLYKLN